MTLVKENKTMCRRKKYQIEENEVWNWEENWEEAGKEEELEKNYNVAKSDKKINNEISQKHSYVSK